MKNMLSFSRGSAANRRYFEVPKTSRKFIRIIDPTSSIPEPPKEVVPRKSPMPGNADQLLSDLMDEITLPKKSVRGSDDVLLSVLRPMVEKKDTYARTLAEKQKEYRSRKKTQEQKERDSWGGILDIAPNIYTKTRNEEAKRHIGALMNMKPSPSTTKKKPALDKRSQGMKDATSQLSDAYTHLSSGFTIQFDHLAEDGVEHMRRNLGKLIDKFIKGIDYSDKWVAVYQYGTETSKIRPIDEITSAQIYNQLFEEGFLDPGTVEYLDPFESGGAFIPFNIASLNSIKFVNLKYHKLDGCALGTITKKLCPFTKKNLNSAIRNNDLELSDYHLKRLEEALSRKSKNTRREGRFWPYKLTIPFINLERQMIFQSINERSVKAIEGDNCLIYACKMAGVDEAKLNHMRNIIKIRSFSLAKLSIIAEECELSFTVVDGSSSKSFKIGSGGTHISLLLYEGHYMINERIPVSPYFIQHASEVMRSSHTRLWTAEEKRTVCGRKPSGEFIKGAKRDHKLITVLKNIFKVGGFKEIRYGDYMTFSSTLYASKLRSLVDLEYEPRYCCRLKVSPKQNVVVLEEDVPL